MRTTADTALVEQAALVTLLLDRLGLLRADPDADQGDTHELALAVLDGFDRLLSQSRRCSEDRAPAPARTQRDLYDELRRTVHDRVINATPEGARVSVISRGDDVLVAIAGRSASHFPQNDRGEWAGFYPATGADAVALVEAARRRGERFLVVPRTAAWWLEHYGELADHLHAVASVVLSDDHVRIWELDAPAPPTAPRRDRPSPVDALLEAIIPSDVTLARVSADEVDGSSVDDLAAAVPTDGRRVVALLGGRRAWEHHHQTLLDELLHHRVLADRADVLVVELISVEPADPEGAE